MKKITKVKGNDKVLVKSPNAGIPTIYVNTIIPINSIVAEDNIETIIPFLLSNVPITVPSSPVVKRKIIASCGLTIIRIKKDENNTVILREILRTAANAIGSVLNGLKANPITGKNTGADWNSTAIDVNKPPTLINLTVFIF